MAYVSSSFSYPLNFNTYLVAFNLRSPVSTLDKDTKNILIFWFDECEPKDWFKKNEDFDNQVRAKFNKLIEQALNDELDFWATNPEGSLALILSLNILFSPYVSNDGERYMFGIYSYPLPSLLQEVTKK